MLLVVAGLLRDVFTRGQPINWFCRLICTDSRLLEPSAKIHGNRFPGCVHCWNGWGGPLSLYCTVWEWPLEVNHEHHVLFVLTREAARYIQQHISDPDLKQTIKPYIYSTPQFIFFHNGKVINLLTRCNISRERTTVFVPLRLRRCYISST